MVLSQVSLGVIRRLIRWVIRLIPVEGMEEGEVGISKEVTGMGSLDTTDARPVMGNEGIVKYCETSRRK